MGVQRPLQRLSDMGAGGGTIVDSLLGTNILFDTRGQESARKVIQKSSVDL